MIRDSRIEAADLNQEAVALKSKIQENSAGLGI
jgi:hypothetical protein